MVAVLFIPSMAHSKEAKSNVRLKPEMHQRRALVTWSKPNQARNLGRKGSKQYYLATTSERARQKRNELLSKKRSARRMAELKRLILAPKTTKGRLRKALLPLIRGRRPAEAKTIVEAVLLDAKLASLKNQDIPNPREKYKALKNTARSSRIKEKLHRLKMERHQRQALEASELIELRAEQLFAIFKEQFSK